MHVADWGERSGPLAAFGGCVSNLPATQALVDTLFDEGLLDGAICTGDLAAYCASPEETVRLVRAAGVPVVAGNCEIGLAAGSAECGCGFAPGTVCDRMSGAWWAHAAREVNDEQRAWMAGLPEMAVLMHEGARTAVIHGGATDAARFVWPSDDDAVFAEEIAALERRAGPVSRVIAGHCGIAFARDVRIGDRTVRWINAGSVGMPPHDGRPRTRFAVIDPQGHAVFRRLDYDHAAAAASMRAAGLVQGYERALETGFWPSEDVLPPALRR